MILWIDSLGDLNAETGTAFLTNRGWTVSGTVSRSSTGARTGNCANIQASAYMERSVTASATLIVNFSVNLSVLPAANYHLLDFYDTSTIQSYLRQNTDGTLSFCNGDDTVLATSVSALSVQTLYYLNVEVTINNSTGAYDVDVDGVSWLSGSGADTQNSANATANKVRLSSGSNVTRVDDFIIADTTGTYNKARTDFRAAKVEAKMPSGAGTNTNWTPSAGSNFQCVDEQNANDDTDYVAASAAATKDTYAMANMTATAGTVLGIQTMFRARKDDLTARTVRDIIRSNGVDYNGTTQTMTTSYVDYFRVVETDPDDSNPWDIAGVNAMELGAEVVS